MTVASPLVILPIVFKLGRREPVDLAKNSFQMLLAVDLTASLILANRMLPVSKCSSPDLDRVTL